MPQLRRPAPAVFAVMLVLFAAALSCRSRAAAQPLIDRVPSDAVFYFGWAGTESLAEQYAQSTFKDVAALFDAGRIRSAWRNTLPRLRQEIDSPDFQPSYNHLVAMWGATLRGVAAAYVTPPTEGLGTPGLVLAWQPANPNDRDKLLAGLKYFEQKSDGNAELVIDGNVIALLIGDAAPPTARLAAQANAAHLPDNPGIAEALQHLDPVGPLMAYLDTPALARLLREEILSSVNDAEEADITNAVFDTLNLEGLGAAVLTAGFDGRRWQTRGFLAAAVPRTGLAAMLDAPALTADGLARPPRDTTWALAFSLDPADLMDLARAVAVAAGPEPADAFEQGLAMASSMVGINIEQQLIRGLGSTWSVYLEPDVVGSGFAGLTLVNPLADVEGVERGLRSIQMFGNFALMQQMADEDTKIQIYTQTYGDTDIHTLGVPLVAPSWAIINDQLVVGLYPQTILAALDRADKPGSIAENEDFIELRQRIGTRRITAINWVDLPRTAEVSYQNYLFYEHLLTGMGAMTTGQPMPMILPPLGRLRPHLEPAGAFAWIDDDGWHYTSRSPLPGSTLLGPQGALGLPFGVGVMLPALGASRRTSRQMTDSTQARGIHQAMIIHAEATNADTLTDDIGVLIEGHYFPPDYTISAESDTELPNGINTWPIEEQADWVRANADYILLPGLDYDLDMSIITLFLRPHLYGEWPHNGRGTVTYNDGTTAFEIWNNSDIEEQIRAQTGMDVEQLIARQKALAND